MAKRIMIDGVPHRMRRGKLVPIPSEWVGRTTHPQTIKKRPSKRPGGKHNAKWVKHRQGAGT
jgi:hypothetical protein